MGRRGFLSGVEEVGMARKLFRLETFLDFLYKRNRNSDQGCNFFSREFSIIKESFDGFLLCHPLAFLTALHKTSFQTSFQTLL